MKFEKKAAESILARLDKLAGYVQANFQAMGMPEAEARETVLTLDKLADSIEGDTFGADSLLLRQTEMLGGKQAAAALAEAYRKAAQKTAADKHAQVIQRDRDEGYMDTFKNPMAPIQVEADEGYMRAYGDDQSSAVIHGESTTGRDLAPGHALEEPP